MSHLFSLFGGEGRKLSQTPDVANKMVPSWQLPAGWSMGCMADSKPWQPIQGTPALSCPLKLSENPKPLTPQTPNLAPQTQNPKPPKPEARNLPPKATPQTLLNPPKRPPKPRALGRSPPPPKALLKSCRSSLRNLEAARDSRGPEDPPKPCGLGFRA